MEESKPEPVSESVKAPGQNELKPCPKKEREAFIPTWSDCEAACDAGVESALQRFVYENEPGNAQKAVDFRKQLALVLEESQRASPSVAEGHQKQEQEQFELYFRVAMFLNELGWTARNDAQWHHLRDNLQKLYAMLQSGLGEKDAATATTGALRAALQKFIDMQNAWAEHKLGLVNFEDLKEEYESLLSSHAPKAEKGKTQ